MRKRASTDAPLVTKIREAVVQTEALHHVLGKLRAGANFDAIEKKVSARYEEIRQLGALIPDPPQSFMDLLARAEVARFGADRNQSGEMAKLAS